MATVLVQSNSSASAAFGQQVEGSVRPPAEQVVMDQVRTHLATLGTTEHCVPVSLRLPFLTSNVNINLPCSTSMHDILTMVYSLVPQSALRIVSFPSGRSLAPCTTLRRLYIVGSSVDLSILASLPGGKGGFGSMLRAQGGKMSARKRSGEEDTSACRDLSGRRLSVKRDAERLAAYIQAQPERQRALDERHQARYQKLEKMLGRTPQTQRDFQDAADRITNDETALASATEFDQDFEDRGSTSQAATTNKGKGKGKDNVDDSMPKTRLNDHKFVEQSRQAVAGARNAVAMAMAKKRKNARPFSNGAPAAAFPSAPSPSHL